MNAGNRAGSQNVVFWSVLSSQKGKETWQKNPQPFPWMSRRYTSLCLNLTVSPSSDNISSSLSLTGTHTLTYVLNCSLVARVEIPINNALSALYFFLFFVLPCEWTESTTNVYWNYTASIQMVIAPFIYPFLYKSKFVCKWCRHTRRDDLYDAAALTVAN